MRYLYSLAFAGVVLLSIGGTTKAEDAAEDFFENTGVHALVDSGTCADAYPYELEVGGGSNPQKRKIGRPLTHVNVFSA